MAITDESPVSASNLGAAVGLAAGEGGTGGKPVSAENLAALVEGGGLLALETLWEGAASHDLSVTDARFSETRLYVVDINYTISSGSNHPIIAAIVFSGTSGHSWDVVPDQYSSSYRRTFIAIHQKGSSVVRFQYSDNRDDAGIIRVRGGGLSS